MTETILEKFVLEIKALVSNKQFAEALELISCTDGVLEDENIIRYKALAETGIGEQEKALKSIEMILPKSQEESDCHLAGELAIELGELEKSRIYLTKAIDLSLKSGQKYYLSTCYLERAHINLILGDKKQCADDLNNIDDDISIFWLKGIEPISKKSIMDKLKK